MAAQSSAKWLPTRLAKPCRLAKASLPAPVVCLFYELIRLQQQQQPRLAATNPVSSLEIELKASRRRRSIKSMGHSDSAASWPPGLRSAKIARPLRAALALDWPPLARTAPSLVRLL